MSRQEIKQKAKEQLGGRIFANNWLLALVAVLVYSAIIGFAGGITYGIVVIIITGPLTFGLCKLFIKQARDGQQMNIADLFCGFKTDFSGTLLLSLIEGIFVFLWSLLFVIPGIIKAYSYSMSMYIKVDHPEYDWRQCINESKRLMDGKKMKLFVQDLSFIGWYFVGSLVFGIGVLWVEPYHLAARAQFYESIKE